jgi:hypothetical protein
MKGCLFKLKYLMFHFSLMTILLHHAMRVRSQLFIEFSLINIHIKVIAILGPVDGIICTSVLHAHSAGVRHHPRRSIHRSQTFEHETIRTWYVTKLSAVLTTHVWDVWLNWLRFGIKWRLNNLLLRIRVQLNRGLKSLKKSRHSRHFMG